MPGPRGGTPMQTSRQTASALPDRVPALSPACWESPAQLPRGSLPRLVGALGHGPPPGPCVVEMWRGFLGGHTG